MNRDKIPELFARHGIQATPQRVEIAAIMLAEKQHLSADQVLNRVNNKEPIASKATVYNTLRLLAQMGLIREVIVDPSKIFYDSNTEPHYHFYNVDDGILTDFNTDKLPIGDIPKLPEGTESDGVNVIISIRNA